MRTLARHCLIALAALLLVLTSFDTVSVFAQAAPTQGQLIISEFRFRGPSGASDEFIEIYNTTNSSIDASGVTVFTLQSNGTAANLLTTLPASTIIPAGRSYLVANTSTNGYSLTAYATPDRTVTTGVTDNTGAALCSTAVQADCFTTSNGTSTANRLDAVGFTTAATGQTARPAFVEGTGITLISTTTPADQFSLVRRMERGKPIDTNNNRNDFVLVSTSGAALGRTGTVGTPDGAAILGAPGPQNLTSPIRNTSIAGGLVPGGVPDRTFNSAATVPTVAPAGTLVFNRRYTNNTGGTVTRLRFRIVDITTLNSPDVRAQNGSTNPQQAILRVLNGANATVTVNGVPLQALTLEQPPTQTNGGGLNSSVVYGTFATPTQIAPGGTADVQFQVGVQQTGYYRFITSLEASVTPPAAANRAGVIGRRTF